MAYGLKILNDNSELLVNSEFVNPTFLQKLEFGTTPTYVEPPDGRRHPDYIRRDYATSNFSIDANAKYFILWYLPDTMVPGEPTKDIWYQFSSSSIDLSRNLTCSVYANSLGSPITYTLPTAYIFAINANAINAMPSTGPALRMYDSQGLKTFDSNFIQLVPYSITDVFDIPGADTTTSLYLPVPNQAIYLLPKSAVLFAGDNGFGYSDEKVFDTCYRRRGQYIDSRTISTSFTDGQPQIGTIFVAIFAGNVGDLTIISSDASLYATPNPGTGGGSNAVYTLTSSSSTVNEGQTVVITLTTTLVGDGGEFPYTVTGISSGDLSSGSLTGSFVIYSNTATASFTFANDLATEGTEVFKLSLDGLPQMVEVSVLDTSLPVTSYSFSSTSPINEGTTSSNTFSATNALNKNITFSVIGPNSGVNGSGDVTLITTSFTPTSNNLSTISVSYSVVADAMTEGPEAFRLIATVDGVPVATSDDIIINDTSTAPAATWSITALDTPWAESSTQYASVTVTNYAGQYVYLNTNNSYVTANTSQLYIPNNNYTTTISYTVGDLPSTTNVNLYLRIINAGGSIVSTSTVSVVHTPPVPTYQLYNTFTSLASGSSGTFFLRSTNANGVNVTVSKSGTGSSRVTIDPASFSIGSNATTDTYITVTASVPTVATPAQNVTISLSTGQSFSFTIPEYTLTAPLVSSVTYLYGQTYYGSGETITSIINFNGPITPDLFVRVELDAGVYGVGNNVFQGGQTYSNGDFPVGATSGYYISPANPGIYNTTARVAARSENSDGSIRQSYIYGSYVTLGTGAPA